MKYKVEEKENETTQSEKNWNELRESQGGDESVRHIVAGAGEFMLENPPAVTAAILMTVVSDLRREAAV
jgi:hypothetical protein